MSSDAEVVPLTISSDEAEYLRETLRQQILADEELLRDAIAGREDPEIRLEVSDRIRSLRQLSGVLGPSERACRKLIHLTTRSVLVIAVAVALTTLVSYAGWFVFGEDIPSLYIPVIWITCLRYGKLAGALVLLASAVAYFGTPPYAWDSFRHGLVGFPMMGLVLATCRRYLF